MNANWGKIDNSFEKLTLALKFSYKTFICQFWKDSNKMKCAKIFHGKSIFDSLPTIVVERVYFVRVFYTNLICFKQRVLDYYQEMMTVTVILYISASEVCMASMSAMSQII